MHLVSLLALSLAALSARACPGEEHDHPHQQTLSAYPRTRLPPPSRPLVWGDVNIIHTTDSHGWLLGHQKKSFPEPNYSGDLGDFASFITHMKELAAEKDVDLLLVDSGDLHDGTGLTDGYPPGGINAHETNKYMFDLPYDVMAIGNHELYVYANTLDMHTNFVPRMNGRYLSSNANITVFDEQGNKVSVPVGERFVKFTTRKGRKVTSLGVLFDFKGNDVNTTVQEVEDMVKEHWFTEVIKDEPDFFLLVGHMPVDKTDNWPTVFNAIRAVHPTTPILIFGGHTHIRDCVQYDGRSMALESGRYLETVGWMSAKLDEKGSTKDISFSRRYLDPNPVTYQYHTGADDSTFVTPQGARFKKGLHELAESFHLDEQYGVAPQDYTISQVPYPSNNSLLSLFAQAMSYSLALNNSRAEIPNIILTITGGQRFDVYSGPFTKNDVLTASPFKDLYYYVPNVPFAVASKVLALMNKEGANERQALSAGLDSEAYARGDVDMIYRAWLEEMDWRSHGAELRAAGNATLGYVTHDSCPGLGDDTVHTPLPAFELPDFFGTDTPTGVAADEATDVVFVEFIEKDVLAALNKLQVQKTYTKTDVLLYSDVISNTFLRRYADEYWN